MFTMPNGMAATGSHTAPRPVAEAELLPTFPITEEQAIERIKELDEREERTSFEVSLGIGDIVCQFVRPSDAVDPKGTLQRLSEGTGVALSTLRTRGLVCERLTSDVRAHPKFADNSFTVYAEIAQCPDPDKRAELFDMVLNQLPPSDAKQGRWRVNDIRSLLGRSLATNFTVGSTVEERRAALLNLMGDNDVLFGDQQAPGVLGDVEKAFFEARAPRMVETIQMLEEARRESKRIQEEAALGTPGLQNMTFISKTRGRIETDATHYAAFASELKIGSLQDLGGFLSQLRAPLEILAQAVQHCLDALPDTETPTEDVIIDAQARAAIERMALPGASYTPEIIDVDLSATREPW